MSARPQMLILSLSDISRDARVLKQVRHFESEFEVMTCGFGPQPSVRVHHITLQQDPSRLRSLLTDLCVRLRWYRAAYWLASTVRDARKALSGHGFDVVLSNDLNAAMLTRSIAPASRTHIDLHEYFPGLEDHRPEWVKHRKPYFEWQLKRYVASVASTTTVSAPIAERYSNEFGFEPGVVLNASPYLEASPISHHEPLRFVYSGVAQSHRRIDLVMRAIAGCTQGQELDLYLTGEGTDAHAALVRLAEELGPRISILKPVPHAELTETLQQYDVGIPVLPLEPTNYALAMPNKLFDYIQARLAVVTGPNESMAQLVTDYDLGVVAPDYELTTLIDVVESLTHDQIMEHKQHSDRVARQLSAEAQNAAWDEAVHAIVSGHSAGSGL